MTINEHEHEHDHEHEHENDHEHDHEHDSASPDTGSDPVNELITAIRDIIIEEFPTARQVWFVEDDGHDDPEDRHGHLYAVHGPDDATVLVLGSSDDYQDSPWSWDMDDHAYELHRIAPGLFTATRPGDARRFAVLDVCE